MPSYLDALTQEQLKHMNGAIDTFLAGYKNWGIARGAQQRTVLFFPGGLGSELTRARQPFDPTGGTAYVYRQLWYDIALIRGPEKAALHMAMRREAADSQDHDEDDRFILASGEMDNCVYRPYDGFVDWCGQNGLNLLVCGWDNRRKVDWLVSFFLDHFPDYVRARARSPAHNIDTDINDPLANVYLVGHSEGGMLIKWIINNHQRNLCQNMRLAVTVASPFYGAASQVHRMFEGEPDVGANYTRAELAKAIATMPGGYALFFLDGQTYDDNKDALARDSKDPLQHGPYPLLEYPVLDATDFSRADPYNPEIRGADRRYHDFGWDLAPYIAEGLQQYLLTPQKLDDSIAQRFHNIRGVQTTGGVDRLGTRGSLRWRWIQEPFDPTMDPSPILDGPLEPGDGTIAAWSARLICQDDDHVHTIWGEYDGRHGFEHMFMMEEADVLSKLWELLGTGEPERESRVVMQRRNFEPAPIAELDRVSEELARRATIAPREEATQSIREYVADMDPNRRAALVKRWFIEMARGPRSARR